MNNCIKSWSRKTWSTQWSGERWLGFLLMRDGPPPNHPFYHFNAILSIIKQPLWIPPFMETPTKMRWFRTSQRLSSVMGFRSSYPLVLAQNIHFQCWWLIKLPLLLIQSCKFPFQNLGLNFWTSLKNNIYIYHESCVSLISLVRLSSCHDPG
jgi:hypothetical protein